MKMPDILSKKKENFKYNALSYSLIKENTY